MAQTTLKQGSTGPSVRTVQAALNMDANNRGLKHRSGIGPLIVEGSFGLNTQTRLLEYQKVQWPELKPQGVTAPNTWSALQALLVDAYPFYDVPILKQAANPPSAGSLVWRWWRASANKCLSVWAHSLVVLTLAARLFRIQRTVF